MSRILKIELYMSLFVLFAGIACQDTDEKMEYPATKGTITQENSADWGTLIYNEKYRVQNNVWNKGAVTDDGI
ncbi:MAG TPA: hypothetical protein VF857_09020, partial [Spirochaetota bacterium]